MTNTTQRTETSEDFESTKTVAAPPEAILAALRTPQGVRDWWGPTEGSTDPGGTFEVFFQTHNQLIVLHVDSAGEGRVVWSVLETPRTPEWVGTKIVFEVAPSGEGATLHFRHHGLTPQLECFDMCHAGWTHFLDSLVSYAETGVGEPSRNEAA